MKTPGIGDRVFYTSPGAKPLAAIVAHVHSASCVNLCVFQSDGTTIARTSVLYEEVPGPVSTSWTDKLPEEKKAK